MELSESNIKDVIARYIKIIDDWALQNQYHNNIKHLLYLVLPAFIIRYGIINEQIILKCFKETQIILTNQKDQYVLATYSRSLDYINNNYTVKKYIRINDFTNVKYISLLDSLVHEFNHAVNSLKNEIRYDDSFVYLRTGITTITYSRNNLHVIDLPRDDLILEEVINTKQTEEIINIILSFAKYEYYNIEIDNMLHSLKNEINNDECLSQSYMTQTFVSKELIQNKTFINTIENLRFTGETQDVSNWFNNITGINDSYRQLCVLLNQIFTLEKEYNQSKWFKKHKLNKIIDKVNSLKRIIDYFSDNCLLH